MSFVHQFLVIIILCITAGSVSGQLRISQDGHHITHSDGSPFFYLGETAWNLFHRLTPAEAKRFLKNRSDKGFTVIQAVVLAELAGLNTANCQGNRPLINNDPERPNEEYFREIDELVRYADSLGLYMGLLPSWGDKWNKKWGTDPEVFTPENAKIFGAFLGRRYKDYKVIWILGGDRNPEEEEDYGIIRGMADGLRNEIGNHQLITYHPMGENNSADYFHNETWLDFNMFQSGHATENYPNFLMTEKDYNLKPTKPVLDGEPCYEDHPIRWKKENGYFDDFDSRRAGYWSMLKGACGHTYGNHNIWQFYSDKFAPVSAARTHWSEALDYPGAFQAGYMRKIFEKIAWQELIPNDTLMVSGPDDYTKKIVSAASSSQDTIVVYAPYGSNFVLKLSNSNKSYKGMWCDPRSGNCIDIHNEIKGAQVTFDPPFDEVRGNDWVLILQRR